MLNNELWALKLRPFLRMIARKQYSMAIIALLGGSRFSSKAGLRMNKYVLVKGFAGMGNRIQAVCEAIVYAELTQRRVVVDWRDSQYRIIQGENLFPLLFSSSVIDPASRIPQKASVFPKIWSGHLDKTKYWVVNKFDPDKKGMDPENWYKRVEEKYSVDLSKHDYDEEVVVMFDWVFRWKRFEAHSARLPKEWPKDSEESLLQYLLRNYFVPDEAIRKNVTEFKKMLNDNYNYRATTIKITDLS